MTAVLAALALGAFILALPAAASATACTPAGAPFAAGQPLAGSCFEGYDGDQVDSDGSGNRLDWQSILSSTAAADDFVQAGRDTQFGSGGQEEVPESWTFDFGSLGSGKYDVVSGYSAQEPATNDVMLALAFVRATNNGTTHLAFELNQKLPGYRFATETHSPDTPARQIPVPTRTAGDLLITYSVDPPVIGMCRWTGDEHSGHWLDFAGTVVAGSNCPLLPQDVAQGAMNASAISAADNFLMDHKTALDAKTFAEAAINLTQAVRLVRGIPAGQPDPCFAFSYIWMHSRSSISITSNQQDYILPRDPVGVGNCSVSGVKFDDADGDGQHDAGEAGLAGFTFYADLNDNGKFDAGEPSAVSAADGSYTIGNLPDGTLTIREVGQAGWHCTTPSPCSYSVPMTGHNVGGKDFGNFHAQPAVAIDKKERRGDSGAYVDGPIDVHVGDTVEYQLTVTNPGNVALTPTVTDPVCDGAPAFASGDTDADGKLDTTETWVYTCSHVATDGDGALVHNVGTVTATDDYGDTVSDSDAADANVLHPAIQIVKIANVAAAHIGDTITYTLTVTSTGDTALANVKVTDPRCDAAPVGPSGDTDADNVLDLGESWVYSCSHVLQAGDALPFVNVATATGDDVLGKTVSDDDKAAVNGLLPGLQVVKDGSAYAYHGDTVSYTFAVTNTGNQPLHDVAVTDDHCIVGADPVDKRNDDGDALLEAVGADGSAPEVWVFSCSYPLAAHATGEENPIHNIATATALDPTGTKVTAFGDHLTTVLHPAVAIDKTGPATAQAGDRVAYQLAVTNPGDESLAGETLAVTDALCEAPPALVAKGRAGGADPTPDTLDPGDTWLYTCTVATKAGQTSVDNVADVKGVDVHGKVVTATDEAKTALTQPQIQVLPETIVSGAAKLHGPAACVRRAFTVRVTGRRIARVTFTVDGRTIKVMRNARGEGKRFSLRINPSRYGTGVHRLSARVVYNAKAQTKARTLRLAFERCSPSAIAPEFTG